MSNFPCSLTRNITSHSMKNMAFHSLLIWKMIILPILTISLTRFSWTVFENVLFELGSGRVTILIVIFLVTVFKNNHVVDWRFDHLCGIVIFSQWENFLSSLYCISSDDVSSLTLKMVAPRLIQINFCSFSTDAYQRFFLFYNYTKWYVLGVPFLDSQLQYIRNVYIYDVMPNLYVQNTSLGITPVIKIFCDNFTLSTLTFQPKVK